MNASDPLPTPRVPGHPVLAKSTVPAGTVKLDDLAPSVMTDFLLATPITVDGETPIDEALQHMIHAGVRLLFLIGSDSRLIGLVTSNDILGEKPIRHMQAIACMDRTCSRREIRFSDIMTPAASWEALDYGDGAPRHRCACGRHLQSRRAPPFAGGRALGAARPMPRARPFFGEPPGAAVGLDVRRVPR